MIGKSKKEILDIEEFPAFAGTVESYQLRMRIWHDVHCLSSCV